MKKTCFYIGPRGEKNSLTKLWVDNTLSFLITPVIQSIGYKKPVDIDTIAAGSPFSAEVVRHLIEDNIVVADLTEEDPRVFYYLAIRHLMQKPVVHVIRKGDPIPRNFQDLHIINVRTDDLNLAENARQELRDYILSAESGQIDGTVYLEKFDQLRRLLLSNRDVSEKEVLFNLVKQIEDIQVNVGEIKKEIIDLNKQLGSPIRKTTRASTFVDKRLAKAELIRNKLGKQ